MANNTIKFKVLRRLIFGICLVVFVNRSTYGQIEQPVRWSYGLKKVATGLYEIHLLATMDKDWHIYAQKQPESAIAVPTTIAFDKSTAITLIGIPREIGKKESYVVKEVDATNLEYAGKVDFVQKIKVNGPLKQIKGSVSFQACTHTRCLPEETVNFTIPFKD